MIKLNLRQNALHTLHHAIEHMYLSESYIDDYEDRQYNYDDNSVEWTDKDGRNCFISTDFIVPPNIYNLKFALLHLIQSSELLLKAYVESVDPNKIFEDSKTKRTISFYKALEFTKNQHPSLFSSDEIELLNNAKRLRNQIEHYEFAFDPENLKLICVDFLAICFLMSQNLLKVNLIEAFSYDYLRDEFDPVGDYISTIMSQISDRGKATAGKAGKKWVNSNECEENLLCLNCGANSFSLSYGRCMGCGVEGDEEISRLVMENYLAIEKYETLKKLLEEIQKSDS